jgi:hypothetical protein
MRKNAMWDFKNNRYPCFWRLIMILLFMVPTAAKGGEPLVISAESQRLLNYIPGSTESVFCIGTPFRIWRWDDLNDATAFETATCFTTMLAQQDSKLRFGTHRVRCAVSAVRHIRLPKSDPSRHVVDGPFQSQRCEFLLLPRKVPKDILSDFVETWNKSESLEKKSPATPAYKLHDLAGHQVWEVSESENKFFVTQLEDDILCVSNDLAYLSEVLQLSDPNRSQKADDILSNPFFQTALSKISSSAKFWGVRLFSQKGDSGDPTSVLNDPSIVGFHDPQAVFAVLELQLIDSSNIRFSYASRDAAAATQRFPKNLKEGVKIVKVDAPTTISSPDHRLDYTMGSMLLDLNETVVAGMDQPGVLFLAISCYFGQGMML